VYLELTKENKNILKEIRTIKSEIKNPKLDEFNGYISRVLLVNV